MEARAKLAKFKPFTYQDVATGHKIRIGVSPYYSKLSIDDKTYYFKKDTGEFDGTSFPIKEKGC